MYVELLKWHNVLGRDNKSTLMGVEQYYKTLLHEILKIGKAILFLLIKMVFDITEMKIQPIPPPFSDVRFHECACVICSYCHDPRSCFFGPR